MPDGFVGIALVIGFVTLFEIPSPSSWGIGGCIRQNRPGPGCCLRRAPGVDPYLALARGTRVTCTRFMGAASGLRSTFTVKGSKASSLTVIRYGLAIRL